jgi:hypothetical protein
MLGVLSSIYRQIDTTHFPNPDSILIVDPRLFARHLRWKLDIDRASAKRKKRTRLAISIAPFPYNVYEHFFPRTIGEFRTVSKKSQKKGIIRTTNTHNYSNVRMLDSILGADWDTQTFRVDDQENGEIEGVMNIVVETIANRKPIEIKYVVQDDRLTLKCYVQFCDHLGHVLW